ncbi:MAG: Arc family DNA-binding protein [Propioniciclava sp.]|uniref:FitA-like ribbon-helix-helix domain-containing protein n=1 Tax=Propioniciclava sp. TaxID=2038686 RepID=UPI0039E2A84D
MVTITVRGLDAQVHEALQRRARRHGRSMEAEVRQILADQVRGDVAVPNALIEFHVAMREDPVDLEFPERTVEPPRATAALLSTP